MKTKLIKKQNGFVVSDAVLAILILIMFTGILTSLIYNIVVTSKAIKMNSQEIAYITDVFNHAELMKYNDVTTENLIKYVNEKTEYKSSLSAGTDTSKLNTPYKMLISVQKYNETPGNTEKYDIIKIMQVRVECELAGKTYATEMKALKKMTDSEFAEI